MRRAELIPPGPGAPDGLLVASAAMFLVAPAALPVWLWTVWARRRVRWWILPTATLVATLLAIMARRALLTVYVSLPEQLAAGVHQHGVRPSWGMAGVMVATLSRSLVLTAPVGIPIGLVAGQISSRTQPRPAPIPIGPPRPVPLRVEREPFLAVAARSDPPGDLPAGWRHGKCLAMPPREAGLSTIVVGRPGSGKSVYGYRDTYVRARAGWRGIIVDCKGEGETADEMEHAFRAGWADGDRPGRPTVHRWPQTPLSVWTGGPQAVRDRLLSTWSWNPHNEFWREPLARALQLALNAPAPPVASSVELVQRLRLSALEELWKGHEEAAEAIRELREQRGAAVMLRVGNLMSSLGYLLDGDPTRPLGAADLTIISLPVMAAPHDAGQILRVLLADLAHYIVARKLPGESAFVFADEMSAVEGGRGHLVHSAERGRSAGVSVTMAVQSDAGLGDDQEVNRLVGAASTVVLFNTAEPERLVRLAGSRRQVEQTSTSIGDDGISRYTSTKVWVEQVDPNVVRALPVGHAYIMSGGRAQLAKIIPPPKRARPADGLLELEAP